MSSSLIVEVCRIEEISPHPNADRLDIAHIKGWTTIISKDSYQTGDLAIFIPPDAILPYALHSFLNITQYCVPVSKEDNPACRVRAARIRGIPSYGVLMSIKHYQEYMLLGVKSQQIQKDNSDITIYPHMMPPMEGQCVAEKLEITKWEPPVRSSQGDVVKPNSLFTQYTNIENWRNFPRIFKKGEEIILTEKIHGCLHAGTLILMADNTEKHIRDVRVGDEVVSWNIKTQARTSNKVTKVFKRKLNSKLQWVKLFLHNGRKLICTECHPFLTDRKTKGLYDTWITAKELDYREIQHHVKFGQPDINKIYRKELPEQYERYDLEVEYNHNFVAEGVVVHNSNCRIGLVETTPCLNDKGNVVEKEVEWELAAGSHKVQRKRISIKKIKTENDVQKDIQKDIQKKVSLYWQPLDWYPKIADLLEELKNIHNKSVILYGEIYGSGMQDMVYGLKNGKKDFRVFDIKVGETYLDVDDKCDILLKYDIPIVPILYKGPYSREVIEKYTIGDTDVCEIPKCKFKGREGCVITPMKERTDVKLGRVILKSVSADYLARKNPVDN